MEIIAIPKEKYVINKIMSNGKRKLTKQFRFMTQVRYSFDLENHEYTYNKSGANIIFDELEFDKIFTIIGGE